MMSEPHPGGNVNDDRQDLADLVTSIKNTHGVTETEIARRIGVSPATVNTWVHRKRTTRGPRRETLRKLAEAFAISEEKVFAAAGRRMPGPVNSEAEQRLIELFKALTAEQQATVEIQIRGLVEHNQRNGTF